MENATPRDVVINDLRKLFSGHILVGLGLVEKLQMLNIVHPKGMRRDIEEYILKRIRRPMSHPRKMRKFVKAVFDLDMQGETSSIKNAQAAVTLYRAFQKEWEQAISVDSDRNKSKLVVQNTSKAFRPPPVVEVPEAQVIENSSVFPSTTISEVPPSEEFVKFEYDPTGQLVTSPIHATPERTEDSGSLAIASQLIGGSSNGTDSFVARVSVVNGHGYCLFDKFVFHTAVVLEGETVLGIPKNDFLKIAQPFASVKDQLSNLIKNHVLVGHGVEASLASFGIVHPMEGIRDTDKYIRHVLGLNPGNPPLEIVVEKGMNALLLENNCTSIAAAQASMALYQKYKVAWEEGTIRIVAHGESDSLAKSLLLNESKRGAQLLNDHDPPPPSAVNATTGQAHDDDLEQTATQSATVSESTSSNTVVPFKQDPVPVAQKKNVSPPTVQKNMTLPNAGLLPPGGLNELNLFNYDSTGQLLTELTPAHSEFTTDTGILGMDCTMIVIKSKSGISWGEDVARVSVVNEYGYCLYDKFVAPLRPVVDYRTDSTGIRQEDLKNATPRAVVINDLTKLLNGHIVVGLGLKEKLRMLDFVYPKRRDIDRYVEQKIGPMSNCTQKYQMFVKTAFDVDLQGAICSIKGAQVVVTTYKAFQPNWKPSYSDRNKHRDEIMPHQSNDGASGDHAKNAPPVSGMPPTEFVRFEYNSYGQLVTSPIHATPERTKDSGIVAFACQLIGGIKGTISFVARVSIVNEHGYCLLDKFVLHKDVALDCETALGIPNKVFLRIAQPLASVKHQLSELIKNHVVVGHGVKDNLASLGIVHAKEGIRDTDKYIRHTVLGLNRSAPLELVVEKGLKDVRLENNYTSIQAAQASMVLYQKYRENWEKFLQRAHKGVNLLQKSLNEFTKLKERDAQVTIGHYSSNPVVPSTSAELTAHTLTQIVVPFENNNNNNSVPPQSSSSENPPIFQFKYDHFGSLLTPLTSENLGLTGKTEVVSVACTLISVGGQIMVGRVSVVNLHGYCLYDKLVKPRTTPKNENPIDYRTDITGITAKNMAQGIARETMLREIRALLQGRTLICHKGKDILSKLLKHDHPPGSIRETSEFVRQKLGLARKADFYTLAMKALDVNLTKEKLRSSVSHAQALMLIYRKYHQEWEVYVTKFNAVVKSFENMIVTGGVFFGGSIISRQENIVVPESLVPKVEVDRQKALAALTRFEYDLSGTLLQVGKPTNNIQPAWWTEAVALDCEMVEVIQNGCRKDALGRISVVNEHGYCLYDSFVKPNLPVSDYRTGFSGIREGDLINAPLHDDVVAELKTLLEGHIVVGHAIFENDFSKVLPIWHPELKVRDTSIYYQFDRKMGYQPALKRLAKEFFRVDIQKKPHNPIQDAQAAMSLYLLEKGKCDKLFELLSNIYRDQFGSSSEGIKMFLTALRRVLEGFREKPINHQ